MLLWLLLLRRSRLPTHCHGRSLGNLLLLVLLVPRRLYLVRWWRLLRRTRHRR